ncbi:MAG: phosphate/phosphite/phosphonate ABC transporter substrate-binding protein [Pseudomonadota bacterium]|nr:phosphate/phosphite/phosphonate ABC transporter substrate-binding protein [Pseudomonadota bacterium]
MKIFYLIFIMLIAPISAATESTQSFTFGVVPQQAASKLARLWTPILRYLSERSGYTLRFKTTPTIPDFEQQLIEGQYDLAYMNPYHYVVFHRAPGYQAFAKEKDKKIKGIIVVRQDSSLQTIAELKDETLAFPAPAAFAASILPRAHLNNADINITPEYVLSHDSVYHAVARELYPAGGGVIRTFENVNAKVHAQLRILWTTQAYTPHAIAAHPRIATEVVHKIAQMMYTMHQTPQGQSLLAQIEFNGIEAAEDADWDDIRALKIEQLKVPIGTAAQ